MLFRSGGGVLLDDIVEKGYNPLSLRYLFAQAHYRSKQNFTWEAMSGAENGLKKLYRDFLSLGERSGDVDEKYKNEFSLALGDDFNISKALSVVSGVFSSPLSNEDKRVTLLDFDRVLGFKLSELKQEEIPAGVQKLVDEREEARAQKKWARADELRDKIEKMGYVVEDADGEVRVVKK